MSSDSKERMGMAMIWIFRLLTAVGSVFLFETYREIKSQSITLEDMRRDGQSNDMFYRMKIDEHGRTLDRHDAFIEHYRTNIK